MRLRAILAAAVAAVGLAVFAPAGAAQAAPYPPTVCASLSVSTTNPQAGAVITVSGINFLPNADVRLELHTRVWFLGTAHTDGGGSFTLDVRLPAGVFGNHLIVAESGAPDLEDCASDPVQIIHIQGPGDNDNEGGLPGGNEGGLPGNHGGTAFTGIDIFALIAAAAALLAVGVAVNRSGRRRRSSASRL